MRQDFERRPFLRIGLVAQLRIAQRLDHRGDLLGGVFDFVSGAGKFAGLEQLVGGSFFRHSHNSRVEMQKSNRKKSEFAAHNLNYRRASAILPLVIKSPMRSKSEARLRSRSSTGETARIAKCAIWPRRLVVSGFKKSSACAAASASIASTARAFATIRLSFSAAAMPMET